MYKSLDENETKNFEEILELSLTFKQEWEGAAINTWASVPSHIIGRVGQEAQELFECYSSTYDGNLDILQLRTTDWLDKQHKGLIDLYLKLAIKMLVKYAKNGYYKRLIIASYIPSAFEHLVDFDFSLRKGGTTKRPLAMGHLYLTR